MHPATTLNLYLNIDSSWSLPDIFTSIGGVVSQFTKINVFYYFGQLLFLPPKQCKNFLPCCCCLVTKPCLTLCDPMDCSMPCFLVLHHLLEFAQTFVFQTHIPLFCSQCHCLSWFRLPLWQQVTYLSFVFTNCCTTLWCCYPWLVVLLFSFVLLYLLTSYSCIPVPYDEKDIFFLVLFLEGLVRHHRTVQLQLL